MSRLLYIARKILTSGGYGMIYNWWMTQQQPIVNNGFLYNRFAVTDARYLCSSGWSIPTQAQINTLITYCGGGAYPLLKLRETGTVHWASGSGATNEYGLNLRGSGYRNYSDGVFTGLNNYAYIATQTGSYWYVLQGNVNGSYVLNSNFNTAGFSVRPIKNSTTLTHGQTGTYIDPSGIIYPTICIGTQEWVACNIMTKHYRNGDAIPEVTDNTAWAALTTGGRCSYNNTEANAGSTKKISSSDSFIVPTKTIWEGLLNYVDAYDEGIPGWTLAGSKLKESGFTHWRNDEFSIEGLDLYGFKVVGSGLRSQDGDFDSLKNPFKSISQIHANSLDTDSFSLFIEFHYDSEYAQIGLHDIESGCSIRLCNPTTSHPNGYIGSYTQNDGTVIPTIVINGVEWTMNLKETKWSDGTDIPTVTDNTAWSLLQEAACCDIDNDPTKR